jgi:hypothetical protein
VTARESPRDVTRAARFRIGRTEAIVDAELGILLRVSRTDGGDAPSVTELVSLDVNPAIDAATFAPPPGSVIAQSFQESLAQGGPVGAAWRTVAGLAAGGVGAWIKYSPFARGRAQDPDAEAAMPQAEPAPEVSRYGRLSGPEVGDEVLHLLYGSGTGAFAATVHQWLDFGAVLSQVPDAVRRTGFGGLGVLVSALEQQTAGASHQVSVLRVGGPGRYQVDYRDDREPRTKSIACNGQRRWQVHRDKVIVGRVRPLPPDLADLADASWLLECRLSDGALVMARDRPAYRVNVARGDAPWSFSTMFSPAVAVVDAELGIVLSLTSYLGDKPVRRYELRDIAGPADTDDFRVQIPPGLRIEEESDTWQPDASRPVTPLTVANAVAREVGSQATKAVRTFLRRMGIS